MERIGPKGLLLSAHLGPSGRIGFRPTALAFAHVGACDRPMLGSTIFVSPHLLAQYLSSGGGMCLTQELLVAYLRCAHF